MVGIGGGAPTQERDIRLGDVVVSEPQGTLGGVVQYDLGKRLSGGRFQRTGQLDGPPPVLLGAIPEMKLRHNDPKKPDGIAEHIKLMDDMLAYRRPTEDRFYSADYEHKGGKTCADCKADGLRKRPPRDSSRAVNVHYGIIASADSVMKNAKERDQCATDPELNILCFEMEAGGLMNNFPCLVIRGICDYSDSHKNDEWHNYAALAAAAYARELLHVLKPVKVAAAQSWAGRMETSEYTTDQIIHTQEHEKILEWLTSNDIDSDLQQRYIKERHQGTGQWLLNSAEFRTWLNTSKKTLFCPGMPGAGKTIITSIVSDGIQDDSDHNKIGIAFVYCDFQRKPENILRSLLKQLILEQPSVPRGVKLLYDKYKTRPCSVSISDFSESLLSVVSDFSRLFIVIDALDEYEPQDRTYVLDKIWDLQAKTRANLFTTSRPLEKIIKEIEKKFKGRLSSLPIRAREEDMGNYLDGRMSTLEVLHEENKGLSEEIKTKIIKAADGVFLLARLHLDSLADKTTRNMIDGALKTLPTGRYALHEAYGKTIKRIRSQSPGFQLLAERVLSLLTCAKRLLTILELRHALAVKPGASTLDGKDLPFPNIIPTVCAGLVTVDEVAVDEDSRTVRFLHDTTRDYLETHMFCIIPRKDPETQRTLTTICVTYLSFEVFESGFCRTDDEFEERLRSNPLYDYAAYNWAHHAREASVKEGLVLDLLGNKNKVSAFNQALMASKQNGSSTYSQEIPRQTTGVHLAAYLGLEDIVMALLQMKHNPNAKDSHDRTPLSWAAAKGYEAVVKLLLERNDVDVDSRDNIGQTPLSLAAEYGHQIIAKLLLDTGKVNPDAKVSYGPDAAVVGGRVWSPDHRETVARYR
ncbi:hypothetical protein DL98DRAFT_439187 [Cadophora sp. DSE1049]|nr:hypothetical protein DL98DRAFT_439187 [Cadophora sp. DSE1049]